MLGLSQFTSNQAQKTTLAALAGVPNAAGSGAGTAVTVTISSFVDQYGTGQLPAAYSVQVTPSQACAVSITSKTSSGFNVVLTPLSPGGVNATLAAGTFDVVVVG